MYGSLVYKFMSLHIWSQNVKTFVTYIWKCTCVHSYRSLCVEWPREAIKWPTFENARVCILIGLFINVRWPNVGHLTFTKRPARMHTRAFSRDRKLVHVEGPLYRSFLYKYWSVCTIWIKIGLFVHVKRPIWMRECIHTLQHTTTHCNTLQHTATTHMQRTTTTLAYTRIAL